MTRGMLVAAGFGTRLAPLSDELPKPAVPVGNRPLGAFALEHLVAAGVTELVANTHHLPERLEAALTPHVPSTASLVFVNEPEILGTGGGVKHAWRAPHDSPFVVMNAKLLFAPDIARLLQVHEASGALATLVLRDMPAGATFGPVDIDREGNVRALLAAELASGLSRCMFTGVYVLHPRAHERLPESGCLVRDGLIPWLAGGERVASILEPGPFRDAGISTRHYHQANLELLDGRLSWPGIAPDAATMSLIDPTARVHPDASLTRCAVGAGAEVGPVTLSDTVLWPDAHVSEALDRAVVTTAGRVVPVP